MEKHHDTNLFKSKQPNLETPKESSIIDYDFIYMCRSSNLLI